MIYSAIQQLIEYSIQNGLITRDDELVIRNQLMTPFNQFKCCLTFPYAALSGKKNANTVDIQKNAMPGNMRGKGTIQIMNCHGNEFTGYQRAGINRNIMRCGSREQIVRRRQATADHEAGNRITEITLEDFFSHIYLLLFQISHLNFANDLRTFKSEELIEAAELHPRPVEVRRPDIPFGL